MEAISIRKYQMTDSKFAFFLVVLTDRIRNNIASFAKFGVTEQEIEEFERQIDAFKAYQTDDYFVGDRMIYTQLKSGIRSKLLKDLREASLRVSLRFGDNSAEAKLANVSSITKLRNADLLLAAYSVLKIVQENKTQLADVGQTEEMLAELAAEIEDFKSTMQKQDASVEARRTNLVAKIAQGNKLFAMAVRFCSIGKRIYPNINSPQHKLFLMYKGRGRKKSETEESPNENAEN